MGSLSRAQLTGVLLLLLMVMELLLLMLVLQLLSLVLIREDDERGLRTRLLGLKWTPRVA
jgi:hypothetical protein